MHGHAAISRHGAGALPGDLRPLQLLLHGNAGALAGGMVGTALAVVERLHADERVVHAWVTETRPTLEGARLTAWELAHAGVPTTVIADGAVAWLLAQRSIDALLLGADWIAANGDTANIVGSRMVAALCFRHRVPVLVCAPATTGDPATPTGDDIPTELRPEDELFERAIGAARLIGVDARNPASDIVPAALISAFVTEHGVVRPPFGASPGGAA
jgi:methylthioribose-1-phosphate isomerase